MVESVDTPDSKFGEHNARAGSSPARGTNINDCPFAGRFFIFLGEAYLLDFKQKISHIHLL
jgi:hypothetical protein